MQSYTANNCNVWRQSVKKMENLSTENALGFLIITQDRILQEQKKNTWVKLVCLTSSNIFIRPCTNWFLSFLFPQKIKKSEKFTEMDQLKMFGKDFFNFNWINFNYGKLISSLLNGRKWLTKMMNWLLIETI